MLVREAEAIAGRLGKPSKMPGRSYGLPAAKAPWVPDACKAIGVPVPPTWGCPVGAKLAEVAGTTCSQCYANNRGRYQRSSTRAGQARRASGLFRPDWVEAVVTLIERHVDKADPYFRWHDSGDLLGRWHLDMIASVAKRTPWVKHWLPTREAGVVAAYLRDFGGLPPNLTVRVPAGKIDGRPPRTLPGLTTSTTHDKAKPYGRKCPAPSQGNMCGACRACWSRKVPNVSYQVH